MFLCAKNKKKKIRPKIDEGTDRPWEEFALPRKSVNDISQDKPPGGCLESLGRCTNSANADRDTVGFCSLDGRMDWCRKNNMNVIQRLQVPKSLVADKNPTAPLYFWQLYSLMGKDMIRHLVSDFYKEIFLDTEEIWFRMGFINGDQTHHARQQERYWIDAFGGGPTYPGGETRINFHHEVHAGRDVMTEDGAERWMYHMTTVLIDKEHGKRLNKVDKRIFPCLIDFLETKMEKYAARFGWEFDPTPFDALRDHDRCIQEERANEKGGGEGEGEEGTMMRVESPGEVVVALNAGVDAVVHASSAIPGEQLPVTEQDQ